MTQNTQQHSRRNDVGRVNDVDLSGIKNQLQENAQQIAALTTLVSKIVPGNESKARVSGICSDFSHATDECPTLQSEDVNALGSFSGQQNRKYDPFSQTYNEGQISTSLSKLESQLSNKLPSQTLANPNEHAKVVTLRISKELKEPKIKIREVEKEVEVRPKDAVGESKEKHDKE
uniref:Uncharacterized protein n=1 Tax=Chenopodium quinoa TaxID=63459 RepID=A0A803N3X4_CHEQI